MKGILMETRRSLERITMLLCIILFVLCFSVSVQAKEYKQTEAREEVVEEEEEEEEEVWGKPGSEDWDSEIPEAEIKFNLYNGRAWITRMDRNFDDEDYDWENPTCVDACYDENGQLLFTLPEGVRPASVFYDGYALVMEESGISGVIDSEGEMIFTAEDIGADGFIFDIYKNQESSWYPLLRPVEDPFLEEGYIFAYTFEESYKGVEFNIGVVDMNGEWVVPLSGDNIATTAERYSPDELLNGLSYCGEGVWLLVTGGGLSGTQWWFYSLEANEWQRYIGHGTDGDFIFSDGRAIAIDKVSEDMSYLYPPKAGDSLLEYEDIDIWRATGYKDMYLYYYDADAHIIYAYIDNNMIALDDDLNEIFRTDLYEAYPLADSSQGYLPVIIHNNKGTEYWGILDPEGELLFEPIQEDAFRCSRFVMDEELAVFWISGRSYGITDSDGCVVYDVDGEKLFYADTGDWEKISYHNGILELQPEYADEETKYVLLR